jgi:hypothetical protein
MILASQALFALAAAGLLGLAARYGLGAVPLPYHAEIMSRGGGAPGEGGLAVLRAVYRSLAAAFAGFALLVLGAAVVLLPGAPAATAGLIMAASLAAAIPTALATRGVERASGVRTPWRAAVALAGVVILAGAAAILAA